MSGIKLILEIDPGITTVPGLISVINDRVRDLGEDLKILVANPATSDVDLGNFQIHNLGDPSNDLDAVNLRTLRKQPTGDATQQATVSGLDAYTVVFTKDGFPTDGEAAPSFTVDKAREGTALRAWFRCKGPPTSDATFNFKVTEPKGVEADAKTVLSADVVIPAGSVRTIFSEKILYKKRMITDSVVDIVIVVAGGCSMLSAGLIVGRS